MNVDYPIEYTYVIADTSPSNYSYKKNARVDIYQDKEYLIEDIEKCFDREYYYWKEKVSRYKR